MAMTDFNVLTFNSRAFPGTDPLVVRTGDRVRIRFANLSAMDHHPIHLHGFVFRTTATGGGPIAASAQWPDTTVLVPVGSTRDIEFVADLPGDWPMHCHMTHHDMTQMGHDVPNLIGVDDSGVTRKLMKAAPGTMMMGTAGMNDMYEMDMPMPKNSLPMRPTPGPYGNIDMGGMFTILKVRDVVTAKSATDFYEQPKGTRADVASVDELARDGIVVPAAKAKPTP
jgi:hypothetical protein